MLDGATWRRLIRITLLLVENLSKRTFPSLLQTVLSPQSTKEKRDSYISSRRDSNPLPHPSKYFKRVFTPKTTVPWLTDILLFLMSHWVVLHRLEYNSKILQMQHMFKAYAIILCFEIKHAASKIILNNWQVKHNFSNQWQLIKLS